MNPFRIKRTLPINTIFCIVLFFPGITKTTIHSADVLRGDKLTVYGRGDLDKDNHVELISSGAHIGFQFTGKSCRVYAYLKSENDYNYVQYELDGIYQKRIKITGNVSQPVIITAKSEGLHTVWIYKATEAHTGPVYIKKISGKTLSAIRKPNSKLIEFIGNSITCGAAAKHQKLLAGQVLTMISTMHITRTGRG